MAENHIRLEFYPLSRLKNHFDLRLECLRSYWNIFYFRHNLFCHLLLLVLHLVPPQPVLVDGGKAPGQRKLKRKCNVDLRDDNRYGKGQNEDTGEGTESSN